ncbi:MAG: M50 family metallopeptidase [Acidimicrobiales bacterium]
MSWIRTEPGAGGDPGDGPATDRIPAANGAPPPGAFAPTKPGKSRFVPSSLKPPGPGSGSPEPSDAGSAGPNPGDAAPGAGADLGPAGNQAASVLRLVFVIALVVVVSTLAGVGKTVAVLAAIILMIVLHEFGHFIMAKAAKVKVTEFFVGFGTRLWSIRKGETEYGVKVLPLGGYVKIIGMNSLEDVEPADEPRTYRQQPFGRRLSIAVAGSAMHFLIALLLLFAIFFAIGDQGFYVNAPSTDLKVAQIDGLVGSPSPAQVAGFKLGDRIVSIDGRTFPDDNAMTNYIRSRPGQRLDFVVERQGHDVHLYPVTADLSKVKVQSSAGAPPPTSTPEGFIGISPESIPIRFGFFESWSQAGGSFVHIGAFTFDALGSLFSLHGISSYAHILVNKKAADAPGALRFESPVGITVLAQQAASSGLEDVLNLLVLINIFVGIFNMVPLLPLDGGHVAIAVYEKLRSRRGRRYYADAAKMLPFVYATLAVIAFIGVSALFLDLRDVLHLSLIPLLR